jgi:hypothetical protein
VERDRLVAEDVFSWGDGRWDGYGPGVVVRDQRVGGPCTRCGRAVDEAGFVDLVE